MDSSSISRDCNKNGILATHGEERLPVPYVTLLPLLDVEPHRSFRHGHDAAESGNSAF